MPVISAKASTISGMLIASAVVVVMSFRLPGKNSRARREHSASVLNKRSCSEAALTYKFSLTKQPIARRCGLRNVRTPLAAFILAAAALLVLGAGCAVQPAAPRVRATA